MQSQARTQILSTSSPTHRFRFYLDDASDTGLWYDDRFIILRWHGGPPEAKLLASITQVGKGIEAHFASNKAGLRYVSQMLKEGIDFIFDTFPWCQCIYAPVHLKSVERIVERLGYQFLVRTQADDGTALKVYIYRRGKWHGKEQEQQGSQESREVSV